MSLRRVMIVAFSSIVFLLGTLTWLLATPWGSRLTLAIVDMVPGIEVKYGQGTLVDELFLERFLVVLDGMQIEIEQVHLDLNLRCILKKTLCVEDLSAEKFVLNLQSHADPSGNDHSHNGSNQAGSKSNELAPEDNELIALPFTIEGKRVAVGYGSIIINDIVIEVTGFAAGVKLVDALIRVEGARAISVKVEIPASEEQQAEPEKQADPGKHPVAAPWTMTNMPTLSIPLNLDIIDLLVDNVSLIWSDTILAAQDIALTANWQWADVQLDKLGLRYGEVGRIELHGKALLSELYPLVLSASADVEHFKLWPPLNQSQIVTELTGNMAHMAFSLESEGALQLQTQGNVQLAAAGLPFSISLHAPRLPVAMTGPVQISSLTVSADGDIERQQISLAAQISGFGYDNALVEAKLSHQQQRVDIERLHLLAAQRNSEATISGSLDYQNGIHWQAAAQLQNVFLPQPLPATGQFNGQFNSQGDVVDDTWQVRLFDADLWGQFNQMPAVIKGDFSLNHLWQMTKSSLHLELNDLILDLQGHTDNQWHLAGVLEARTLYRWQPSLKGQGLVNVAISGPLNDPVIGFDGQFKQLLWQQISIPSLVLKGEYQPMNNHRSRARLEIERLYQGDLDVRQLELVFDGDLSQQQVTFSSAGDIRTRLSLNGLWSEPQKQWYGTLSDSQLGYQKFQWTLDDKIKLGFELDSARLSLSAHCWLGQENQLCLQTDTKIGATGVLDFAIDADLGAIDEFILPEELELETRLDGQLKISWTPDAIFDLDANFVIDAGQLLLITEQAPAEIVNWQTGLMNFSIKDRNASLKIAIEQQQQQSLLDIELLISEQWQQVKGSVAIYDLRLEPLATFIGEITQLDGGLSADLQLSGSLVAPDLEGNVNIIEAELGLFSTPQPLEAVTLSLDFAGQKADLKGSFTVGGEQADINGSANWQQQFQLDMDIVAEQLTLLYPPMVAATIKPDLSLSLRPQKLILKGQMSVLSGMLKLEQLPQGSVRPSSDQIFVDNSGKQIQRQQPFDIDIDIRLTIDPKLEVEGVGFRGHLGGQLHLTQKKHQPLQIFGSLQIPDGSYRAYGQRLQVKKGEISFNGAADNPHINLRAIREITKEGIIVGIQVLGLANDMSLSFFSEPAMPQPEVMSYLVRGRGLDAETGHNAMLAMAVGARLSNKSSILQELGSVPLIHRIEVDTEGGGDETQATISGYIGDRIYLKYGVGVFEPINELTVRFYFLNRLWLESVSGLVNSADLYYSFDIE